jgi:hypothetical protein
MEKGGIMEAQKFKNDLKKLGGYTFICMVLLPKDLCNNNGTTTFSKQDS